MFVIMERFVLAINVLHYIIKSIIICQVDTIIVVEDALTCFCQLHFVGPATFFTLMSGQNLMLFISV